MKNAAKDYERGLRIANKRKELGMSQDEMADRIGIGRQALSAIENGGAFKTTTLDKLTEILGVTETYIMRGNMSDNKADLIEEAVEVMSDMDELQIKQFIAMMRAVRQTS